MKRDLTACCSDFFVPTMSNGAIAAILIASVILYVLLLVYLLFFLKKKSATDVANEEIGAEKTLTLVSSKPRFIGVAGGEEELSAKNTLLASVKA